MVPRLAQLSTLLSISILSVYAQSSFQPTIATRAASAFIDGRGLYISSGIKPPRSVSQQTFMIDLSVSWNTGAPAYKALSTGPAQNNSASAISADGKKWFTLAAGVGQVYDMSTDKWTVIFANKAMEKLWGRGAATDPTTGLVYIPFAYPNSDGTFSMLKVDLEDGSISRDNSTRTLPNPAQYAVAWSTPLRSLVYVMEGGMYTYNSINGWKNFTTSPKFTLPMGSCLVAANGGSQMVLFGGYSKATNVTLSNIYILDVATSTWTIGPSAPISDRRQTPACAVSNDHFIAWGGDTIVGTEVVAPTNLTVVYNLRTSTWTTEYVAPKTTAFFGESDSESSINTSVIITAVVLSVFLVLLAMGALLIYRKRSKRSVASTMPPAPEAPASPLSPIVPPIPPPKNKNRAAQPKMDKPSQGTAAERVDVRLGTVQLGTCGTRPMSHDPECHIELIVSQEAELVMQHPAPSSQPVNSAPLLQPPPPIRPSLPVRTSLPIKPPFPHLAPPSVASQPPAKSRSSHLAPPMRLASSALLSPTSHLIPYSCKQPSFTESTVTEVIELYYDPQLYS